MEITTTEDKIIDHNHEALVPFELAILAKEKGFDWWVKQYYDKILIEGDSDSLEYRPKGHVELDYEIFRNNDDRTDYSNRNHIMCSAPTLSHLQKWLREVHNVQITVGHSDSNNKYFDPRDIRIGGNSYEEVLHYALIRELKKID